MMPPLHLAFVVQGRVISALVLREIHTLYGDTRLGYLWAVIQTIFGIAIFWSVREALGVNVPNNLGIIVFLLCGFAPWNIFNDTVQRCIKAENANKALLSFPQVKELDLMLGRVIVVWGTQTISACIILCVALALGEKIYLYNPLALSSTLFCAPILGLGVGLISVSLARFWSPFDKIIPMVLRIFFFLSGVFYSITTLPHRISKILMLNPVAQLIEWQRYGFSSIAFKPHHDIVYISLFCFVCLFVGLLFERYTRLQVQR